MLDSLDSISFAATLSFPDEHHDLEAGSYDAPLMTSAPALLPLSWSGNRAARG